MKKSLLILLLSLLGMAPLRASHFMGGEIWWECTVTGRYIFHLRVYQECAGILYSFNEHLNSTIPGHSTIPMIFVDTNDISPVCSGNPAFPHITCAGIAAAGTSNAGGVREWLYRSDSMLLPNVVPPVTGWTISFTGCCRNPCSNIVGSTSMNWFLQATMYPYNGTAAQACYDNSPVFAERPAMVGCTGYPSQYNHNGIDDDGDSLSFGWAQPWTANNTPVLPGSYATGFSWDSPLPGPGHHPDNIPATVNPHTGEISFTSYTSGAFVTKTRCNAYRNGILVSCVYREIQFVILPCDTMNNPPIVTPAFPGNVEVYTDTVYPGTLVNFTLEATDVEFLNDTMTPQSITFTASGVQFGDGFTSYTSGCLEPPCAVLNPPPPTVTPVQQTVMFDWQPTCDHLSYGYGNNDEFVDYLFVFNFGDDFCPLPGKTTRTVHIVVQDPLLSAPVLDNFSVDPVTGHVTLFWNPQVDSLNSFHSYHIFAKHLAGGEFVAIDSIFDIQQEEYTDTTTNALQEYFWYLLKCKSGCADRIKFSNSSNVMTNFVVGQDQAADEPEARVRFLPSSGILACDLILAQRSDLVFQLYNDKGSLVHRQRERVQQGLNHLEFPVGSIGPGVYFYRFSTGESTFTGKLVLVK